MIYMFLSNNPSMGDINSSNLSCFSYFSTITYVVSTQKNCLNEAVLLSTQNLCLNCRVRKYLQFYAKCFSLTGPMIKSATHISLS